MPGFGKPQGTVRTSDDTVSKRLRPYVDYLMGVEKEPKGFVTDGPPVLTNDVDRHIKAFKDAAKLRGYALDIDAFNNDDDRTSNLQMEIKPKREFTDLTTAKRDAGRTRNQADNAETRARTAALAKTMDAEELEAIAKERREEADTLTREAAKLQVAEYKRLEAELKTAKENGESNLSVKVKATMKAQEDAVKLTKLVQEIDTRNGQAPKTPPIKAGAAKGTAAAK